MSQSGEPPMTGTPEKLDDNELDAETERDIVTLLSNQTAVARSIGKDDYGLRRKLRNDARTALRSRIRTLIEEARKEGRGGLCPRCEGEGEIDGMNCERCEGQMYVR